MSSGHRLEVVPDAWYAMEIFGATGAPSNSHVSPIYIWTVEPLRSGRSLLKLEFFHASYPEGVQDKEWVLRVVHRARSHFAAVRADDEEQPLVVIFSLEQNWIGTHFPHFDSSMKPGKP